MNDQKDTALARVEGLDADMLERAGFTTMNGFALLQRGAQLLASSTLLPDTYHNNLGNCAIVLELSQRIQASPLLIAQNLYIVHGRPGWSSQFLIASVNQCGRFTALKFDWQGAQPDGDGWGCRATATEKSTGETVRGPLVTIKMAKDEGWFARNGSKWKTIPELMLMYRAATFFARTHAPELTMGLPTREEVFDTIDGEGVDPETGEIVGRRPAPRVIEMPRAKTEKEKPDPRSPSAPTPAAPTPAATTAPAAAQTHGGPAPTVAASVPAAIAPTQGTHRIVKVEERKSQNGRAYYLITTDADLTVHTWSSTVAGDAGAAKTEGRAVTFLGKPTSFGAAPFQVTGIVAVEEREPGEDG